MGAALVLRAQEEEDRCRLLLIGRMAPEPQGPPAETSHRPPHLPVAQADRHPRVQVAVQVVSLRDLSRECRVEHFQQATHHLRKDEQRRRAQARVRFPQGIIRLMRAEPVRCPFPGSDREAQTATRRHPSVAGVAPCCRESREWPVALDNGRESLDWRLGPLGAASLARSSPAAGPLRDQAVEMVSAPRSHCRLCQETALRRGQVATSLVL